MYNLSVGKKMRKFMSTFRHHTCVSHEKFVMISLKSSWGIQGHPFWINPFCSLQNKINVTHTQTHTCEHMHPHDIHTEFKTVVN